MTRDTKDLELAVRRYKAALTRQIYGIVLVGEDNRVELVNPACCEMFHLSTDTAKLVGMSSVEFLGLIAPAYADPAGTMVRIRNIMAEGGLHAAEEVLMADGRVFFVDYIPIVIDGTVRGRIWQHRDITEAKRAEEALKKSEAKVRLLLNSTGEAIYGIDLQGDCTFANPSCIRMLGYPDTEAVLGRNMHRLIHHSYPDGRPMPVDVCRIYQAFREGRGVHVDDEVLWKADGSSLPVEYWSYPQIADGKVYGAVVTFVDITQRKLAEEKILHMATHDGLTDLPNLRIAKDRIVTAISMAHRYSKAAAVMFVDLDGFKAVNDTYGHDAGDEVLREVARRLRSCIRETDTAARVGGDEFLIVATEIQSPENAAGIADKLIRSISQPFPANGRQASIGASIGIALYPRDGDNPNRLIELADQAMYNVKAGGKNGYKFAAPPAL